ncbi:Oligoxyloglucan reducing end-specific cellobiohydrolase [Meira miltonrushii]|uniref:Oligoxyloglucan reducing end-specific cellobiohydrolase n=1 Tax=Meira miltonrushii TaxID=1280837 RepID=A0A316VFU5_9BASI|nr:Oligoxyloglucan reducing end-specific cellobiohydrolase [Meira miltonrushii]PWN36396.1 Oligoxyloglucan reducing end-specific cellobiohydrolase [Meira miltonrushii]
MKFHSILLSLSIFLTACAGTLVKRDFSTTIFTPPPEYETPPVLYARSLLLTVNDAKGTMLATWENYSGKNYSNGVTWFPIFRSLDHGKTWSWFSNVTDQVNGWGLRYQPFLYELKEDFGCYKAGAILLAGNSIPIDLSKTKIDLYISTDKGFTWKFLSSVASGGRADDPENGKTPVWEPFLLVYKKRLLCYYSDQRDPKHGQKLVHQSTSDLLNWSNVVTDMADPGYDARPGMVTIAKMGNGKYIYTFEYCGVNNCNVYYKISKDPRKFGHKPPIQLITQDGVQPFSSPYVVWTPVGAQKRSCGVKTKNGTVVVNSYSNGELYLNHQNGDPHAWTRLSTSSPAQYSRSLAVGFNPKDIEIVGGGLLKTKNNTVTIYSRDVNGFLLTACASTTLFNLTKRDFSTTIFTPPSSYETPPVLYARSLLLTVNDAAGTLLATWENYSGGVTWFPIYRSIDHGKTWSSFSKVTDQVNGWGLRYQPFLLELKQDFGGYKAGAILLAGNSIPADLSKTKIDLYISTDKGSTWKFLSSVAQGGEATATNGKTPVWEPFLLFYGNQLHCFYSDQRDAKHGQKLVHQSSSNLMTWSSVVDDVVDSDYSARPGMATIAQMGNGNYILSFEYCGKNNCNVYYKISNDPTNWNSVGATQLIAQDGTAPSSSPYTIWTPVGAQKGSSGVKTADGTVVVNAYSDSSLFVNKQNGDSKAWTKISTSSPAQYSRSLAVGFNSKDIVIVGAGRLKDKGNSVTLYARDVNGCDTCS